MRSLFLSLCFLSFGCPGGLCGDGALDAGEPCDDGNTANADGCEADCSLPSCQNGIVDPGELCFFEPVELTTDETPADIIAADLNGDGFDDLATVNAGGQSISVLLGDGAGGFFRLPDVELGVFGFKLAVGDFDGDQIQDLAAALSGVSLIRVFRGLGDGSFAPLVELSSSFPDALAVGDWDGDGLLDLAAGGTGIDVFLNLGAGVFLGPDSIPTPAAVSALVSGDFDGSGSLDLAVSVPSQDALSVSLGDGSGGFTTQPPQALGDNPSDLLANDLNEDGILDIAVCRLFSGEIGVLSGDENGLFSEGAILGVGGPDALATGDLNGDGLPDIAVASRLDLDNNAHLAISLGEGAGSFAAPVLFSVGFSGSRELALAELNGDGALDVVFVDDGNSRLLVFLSTP